MGLKFHNVIVGDDMTVLVYSGDKRIAQMTFTNRADFEEWQNVLNGSWSLRELLALRTARRVLSEIAAHAKLGDDSYHDTVIDLAKSWMELYK